MGSSRRRVKITSDELGKVLAVFTYSCSNRNRCKEILRKVTDSVSVKESYLVNAHKEWFIVNMFAIVCACQKTIPRDKYNAVLDAYHPHIYNQLSYDGWTSRQIDEFEILLDGRYKEYREALRTKAPPNPFYYLGKSVTKHMFGEKYSGKWYAILPISITFSDTVKAAREMIQRNYKLM